MGKEKRLFLLAVMTVMMSTAGYGATVIGNNGKPFGPNSQAVKIPKETEISVENDKDEGYRLNAGDKDKKTTVIHNGKITVNNGKGIVLNVADDKKLGDNILTNNSVGQITINGGIGVELYAKNENGGKNTFTNNGKIITNNGIGIKIGHNGAVTNTEKGTITVNSGTGVIINNKTSSFTNNGKLDVNGGVGIEQKQGTFINNNNITVNKGVGIVLKNGEFTNEKDKTINVSGAGNIAIQQTGGTLNNLGTITVENGGIGIDVSADGKLGKTAGTIEVSGEGSTGIKVEDFSSQNQLYNGTINVNSNATGVEIKNGSLKVNTLKVDNATGIKVLNEGQAINIGTTTVNNGGIGVEVLGGTFTNEKMINVSNIDKENTATGIKISENGEATNKTGATVKLTNKGIAVNIDNGKFNNNGKIEIAGGYKGNVGVQLNNGTFINSGEIIGKGLNGAAVAVQSTGGNNTVYLKEDTKLGYFENGKQVATGKIVGADGVDVLALEGTKDGKVYNGLYVENYEKISVINGNVEIGKDSKIELEYNKDEEGYKDKTNEIIGETSSGNLTMSGSDLIIDFKDSLTNPNGSENPIIDVGDDGKLVFKEGMKFDFTSSDGRDIFNLNEALGLKDGQIVVDGNFDDVFKDTAVWEYDNSTGEIVLKKNKYEDVVLKSQLKDFAGIFGNQKNFADKYKDTLGNLTTELNLLDTKGEFTNVMTQMSGGVHGYIVDFAALNARTLTNTMRNRALTRDYMRKRPLNSWTQDISYIDNNHRLGGLMNVDYTEKGVLGISEKQILPNGRIGLVYGGSKGNAKFEDGANGSSSLDGAYFGGYYNHEFNDKWSLNSNANFVYTHNKVTRNIDITYKDKDKKEIKDPIFKSAYPTYTVGMGTSLVYTVKDDLRNKAHFYAGVDVERIMVGNINENKNTNANDENTGLAVKTTSYNARSYYSIVPSAGFMVQNTGYIFDRKYRIGADLNWETEVGNIKDGKRIKLTGLDKEYKIETSERENVFSYSLFGALDLTESLSVNARYTSMFSDEYDADMIGAGFEYKMDTMADNFFGTLAHKIENNRPFSDRWGGTLGIMMETDDADDYTSYFEGVSSGDVATSNQYKPKITLSLNDKQSNWSYFFEAYHKTNNMFGSIKADEKESHAARYHAEARWNDTYSKGTYGMSFGYRNENSDKSDYYSTYGERKRIKTGTHELRLTPSFSYNLGHNFTLSGKSAVVFMYKYEGDREGQMDLNTESQIGVTYTGFMPRWSMTMNFYREDTWYDHSNRKPTWKKDEGIVGYNYAVPKRDQVNQLRPSITYYFGNGASFRFDARIPLGNGDWANNIDGTKGNEGYETRYGLNYYHPVTPGLTLNVGGTFLSSKTKNKDHLGGKYGNITRGYAFRPNIGFYYSF